MTKQELIDNTLANTLDITQESGWMTTVVFYKLFFHFQTHLKSKPEDKMFLILEEH